MLSRLTLRLLNKHTPDTKNLQSISKKPFFKHYQTGINLSLQNKLQQANQEFEISLQQIVQKQKQLEHFSYILKRISHNLRRMGKMKEAEDKLYTMIKYRREHGVNPAILYDDYDVLYRHLLTYNIEKAVKLCKALLLKQQEDMPLSHVKLFNFNLANAYLLAGNCNDAKSRFSKCLDADPQGILKSHALNNLGLACWWHKNPLQITRDQIKPVQLEKVEKDFLQAKQLFAKSVQISEISNGKLDEEAKFAMAEALNFRSGRLSEKLHLTSAQSITPLYNLSQFYLQNYPMQKVQILYFLKKSMDMARQCKKQKQFNRAMAEYCLLTHNFSTIKQSLPAIIEKYRYSQQFMQEAELCLILGKVLLNQSNSKEGNQQEKQISKQKGQQYIKRVQEIRQALPSWIWKTKYLHIHELDLTAVD